MLIGPSRWLCGLLDITPRFPVAGWTPSRGAGVGGMVTLPTMRDVSYAVRDDHLLTVPVRVHQDERADFEALLEAAMLGESIDWYVSADDAEPITVSLESPRVDSEVQWIPDEQYPRVFVPVLVLRNEVPWNLPLFREAVS